MAEWKQVVEEQFSEAVEALVRYCRQPSVSAQNIGIPETIQLVVQMIHDAGGEARVLDDCGGNPVIYASFEPGADGTPDKTLLFYNHYDVQPPEPLDEWTVPPFGAEIHQGKLYARGAADNKGDLTVRLQAITAMQKHGGLPCRVKFLIEGEEEIGSPSLAGYMDKYAELFRADACIWEFGGKDEAERVEMVAGVKGMCYLQLWVNGADVDIHSSLGAVIDNAAWRLTQALATMKTVENDILVEGFYDDVQAPSPLLREIAAQLPYSSTAVEELYGLKRPLIRNSRSQNPVDALLFEPTMTICGLESGYTGPGSKTVLPRRAQAKIDCRLVPNQDPQDILAKVQRHLHVHGFDDIEVSLENGEHAYRSDVTDPFVNLVVETAREAYGSEVVMWPNSAGTGPMYLFGEYLDDLPIVSTGCGWANSRAHAPDESIRLEDFQQAMLHVVLLLNQFARV